MRTASHPRETLRLPWAELLERVFAIDALTCPWCGGPHKLIALLTDDLVVRQILAHLRPPAEPLPLAAARAPPGPVLTGSHAPSAGRAASGDASRAALCPRGLQASLAAIKRAEESPFAAPGRTQPHPNRASSRSRQCYRHDPTRPRGAWKSYPRRERWGLPMWWDRADPKTQGQTR